MIKALSKVTGRVLVVIGVLLGLMNLNGCFERLDRVNFYKLVLRDGPVDLAHPAAKDFMQRFPPPEMGHGAPIKLTKHVMRVSGGPPVMGTLEYFYSDGFRGNPIATYEDIRRWSVETAYPWVAWFLTFLGLVVTLLTDAIDLFQRIKKDKNGSN